MADTIKSMTVETNNGAGVYSDHRPLRVPMSKPEWEEEGRREKYQEMLRENLKEVDQELRSMKRCQGQGRIDRNSIDAVYALTTHEEHH